MNASVKAEFGTKLADPIEVLVCRAQTRAFLWHHDQMSKQEAVDGLQAFADDARLAGTLGPDAVQEIIAEPFKRICDLDGPERIPLSPALEFGPCDDLLRRWELADPRDRWKHTGEAPPSDAVRNSIAPAAPQPYRTPESTIQAFWYVLSLDDENYLNCWLAERPADLPTFRKLLEA